MARQLDDWITSWLEYQENTEPPRQFVKWVSMSIVAAALQRKCSLELGHLKLYPNMYVVIVGPSGSRKGTAMDPGRVILSLQGIKMSAESTTREALIRALKKSTSSMTDIKTGTFEAHASLTVYSQELTSFMGYNNTQLMSDLTDLFDCRDPWNYDTKDETKKDFINATWLNIIGATTPETLQAALPMESVGGGFTSRIIFIYGDKKYKIVPIPYKTEYDLELYEKLKHDLAEIHLMRGKFKYDDSFVKIYTDFRYEHEANPPFKDPRLGGYLDRKPTHLLKMCMILCASQGERMVVTRGTFERALKMLDATEKGMLRVYSGFGDSRDASVLSRVMTEVIMSNELGVEFPELMSKYYYDADEEMMSRIWRTLISMPQFYQQKDETTKTMRMYYLDENKKD